MCVTDSAPHNFGPKGLQDKTALNLVLVVVSLCSDKRLF